MLSKQFGKLRSKKVKSACSLITQNTTDFIFKARKVERYYIYRKILVVLGNLQNKL